jgi:primosomal protein N' (replication factor Y)
VSDATPAPRHADVAVPAPLRRLFSYRVPESLAADLRVGDRVRVPFGPRRIEATVVAWPADPPDPGVSTKAIEAIVPGAPRLSEELLGLTRFVSDYYLCSWGEAIEAALPPERGAGRRVRRVSRLPAADPDSLPLRAIAQRGLLESLPADGRPVAWSSLPRARRDAARALARKGWIRIDDAAALRVAPKPAGGLEVPEDGPEPTRDQARVLRALDEDAGTDAYRPFVLYGATGSGKTEVYLRAARRVVERGRGVLYLVPEIGLTPLLLSRVEARFPGRVAVLHSALPARKRREAWEDVRAGRRSVVIGTRSAIFAPIEGPGLIIVDEEQDGSYKQEETPRYNARDLAVLRARTSRATLILGSATPSLESFSHAASGRYGLLRLGGRIHARPLAEVRVVDMREEYRRAGETTVLSRPLIEALGECVGRGEQALVLRNRRGWAAALLCTACGQRVQCDRCSISMTWHRADRRLRCHHCGLEHRYPDTCPTCGEKELQMLGEGTERVEDQLRKALRNTVVERMDRDAVRGRGAHERLLRRFDRGEIDVLVGTQMIAKGHDFPRVTLVGVLSADQSLGLPDFRAGERTFQLLTQVAGRAGRGERPGIVVVQAFDPGHPVIRLASRQDFEGFYEREMLYRRALRYPPVAALVKIVVSHAEAHRARAWAATLAEAVRDEARGRLIVAGPGPAPVERLRGKHRQQILVRSAGRRRLVETVDRAMARVEKSVPRKAYQVDVDPQSLL